MNFSLLPTRALLALIGLLALSAAAQAQLSVQVSTPRTNYLKGESVVVRLVLKNNSGGPLSFGGVPGRSWLEVFMKDRNGNNVVPRKPSNYKGGRIAAGQTIARNVNLSDLFSMREIGNYSFSFNVRLTEQERGGYSSNRKYINISEGRVLSSSRVGSHKNPVEHRVIAFSADRGTLLFSQVMDVKRSYPINTKNLGEVMLFQNPRTAIDGQLNNHILYLVSPQIYNYVVIDQKGSAIKVAQYKRAATDPRLEIFGDGSVVVAGGIPFDAKKEREKTLTIHKLSDRPQSTYR